MLMHKAEHQVNAYKAGAHCEGLPDEVQEIGNVAGLVQVYSGLSTQILETDLDSGFPDISPAQQPNNKDLDWHLKCFMGLAPAKASSGFAEGRAVHNELDAEHCKMGTAIWGQTVEVLVIL